MKSNLRNEIKSYIVRQGMTMQEIVDLLRDEHGWSDSVSNLSNKLQRESLRYVEAVQLADALGYETVWHTRRYAGTFTSQTHTTTCGRHRTGWRPRRPETESRSAKPEHAGSFRRVRFWKRCCQRCARWNRLCWRGIFHGSWENKSKFQMGGLRKNGGLPLFSPEGRTYSPPRRGGGISCGNRALCEANAAAAAASRQCHSTCECCCHHLRRSQLFPF